MIRYMVSFTTMHRRSIVVIVAQKRALLEPFEVTLDLIADQGSSCSVYAVSVRLCLELFTIYLGAS